MPWWRFMALVSGLSRDSAFLAVLAADDGTVPQKASGGAHRPPEDLSEASEAQVKARLSRIVKFGA